MIPRVALCLVLAGPSVLALLTVSTGLAILILGIVWFVFFRT